jgi:hypothetical protein
MTRREIRQQPRFLEQCVGEIPLSADAGSKATQELEGGPDEGKSEDEKRVTGRLVEVAGADGTEARRQRDHERDTRHPPGKARIDDAVQVAGDIAPDADRDRQRGPASGQDPMLGDQHRDPGHEDERPDAIGGKSPGGKECAQPSQRQSQDEPGRSCPLVRSSHPLGLENLLTFRQRGRHVRSYFVQCL